MRRTSLLTLVALAGLAAGCGDERPGVIADRASPSPAPASPRALDGFPLDLGYDPENGDDHSPVRVDDRPATEPFSLCGVVAWDPRAGTTELLGVAWRGEAEWSRGRTLVLYQSTAAAESAVAASRDAVAGCPDEPAEPGYGSTHTLLDVQLGDESVAWSDTYWSTVNGERGHDTGLTVHHLVRVGRAVLLGYEYGEGNGSEKSRADAIERATELERPVVARMDLVG